MLKSNLRFMEDPTNSMEILNVLIYEDDFKLKYSSNPITKDKEENKKSINNYRPDSLEYLVNKIGKNKSLSIITGVFTEVLEFAISHNYLRYDGDYPAEIVEKVGNGYWTKKSIKNGLKKIQKHLEIYYLNEIYDANDNDMVSEYNKYFGSYLLVIPINSKLKELTKNKLEANEKAKVYNEDLKEIKKYLKLHPEFTKKSKSLYEYADRAETLASLCEIGGDLHYYLSNIALDMKYKSSTIRSLHNENKQLQDEYDSLSDRSKVRKTELTSSMQNNLRSVDNIMTDGFISMNNIKKLTKRNVLTDDELVEYVEFNKNYYYRLINELNDTYGYDRYKII